MNYKTIKIMLAFILLYSTITFATPISMGKFVPVEVVNSMLSYPQINIYFSSNIQSRDNFCAGDKITALINLPVTATKPWVKCENNPYAPFNCLLRFTVCDSHNNWVTNEVCTGSFKDAENISHIYLHAITTKQDPIPTLIVRAGSIKCV